MGDLIMGGAKATAQQGQIDAARITQKSGNERRAAESELQRFNQALGNKKILEAAGRNINAVSENIGRNLDAATFGSFMTSLAASEELGASAAMAAAAGIGGSSVEGYNATIERANAVKQELSDRNFRSDLRNAYESKGQILSQASDSFDRNIYSANLDLRTYEDAKKPSTFGSLITLGLAAGATYFGGPQAGQAVLSIGQGIQQGQMGDFEGGANSITRGIGQGISAYGTAHSVGGDYWGSVKAKNAAASSASPSEAAMNFGLPADIFSTRRASGITF